MCNGYLNQLLLHSTKALLEANLSVQLFESWRQIGVTRWFGEEKIIRIAIAGNFCLSGNFASDLVLK